MSRFTFLRTFLSDFFASNTFLSKFTQKIAQKSTQKSPQGKKSSKKYSKKSFYFTFLNSKPLSWGWAILSLSVIRIAHPNYYVILCIVWALRGPCRIHNNNFEGKKYFTKFIPWLSIAPFPLSSKQHQHNCNALNDLPLVLKGSCQSYLRNMKLWRAWASE